MQFYNGLRVIDLSRILVGPLATMMLADMGAEVIKIESFEGDETRKWGPPFVKDTSSYFMALNRNKMSVCVNLKAHEGQKIIHELVEQADIVIENFNQGVTQRLNLDYETLSKINQKIIYASINGYGHIGPLAKQSGFDFIMQAASGLMSLTGEPDSQPTKIGIAITDILTAHHTVSAIQAAIYQRQIQQRGCYIQTSLYETALASLLNMSSIYLNGGVEPVRYGNMHQSIVPYGVYKVNDQYLMLAAANDSQFQALCRTLGRDDLIGGDYLNNSLRVKNRETLNEQLEKEFNFWDVDNLCQKLNENKVPASKIRSVKEALNNEQILALNLIMTQTNDFHGDIKLVRDPVTFDGVYQTNFSIPPRLNQHQREVMESILRYDKSKIDELIKKGVLKT